MNLYSPRVVQHVLCQPAWLHQMDSMQGTNQSTIAGGPGGGGWRWEAFGSATGGLGFGLAGFRVKGLKGLKGSRV